MTPLDPSTFQQTITHCRERLLNACGECGHWEGRLSSSALSTATAVCALEAYRQAVLTQGRANKLHALVHHGRRWLADNQNQDGGWGDTISSLSNISTTALSWAALADCEKQHNQTIVAAERWLTDAAGGLAPTQLAAAIRSVYGKDRTFSIPILTLLALTGRLGAEEDAWRLVPQLPFELAACPHQWFAWLRLPIVSYALPALISIGHVRHHRRPTKNPLTRSARHILRRRTLTILRSIQPADGGFLEATPLTSFVALSLVGAGEAEHPVTVDSIDFLTRSARDDGSWPIDTNLATWVSTLSINALNSGVDRAASPKVKDPLQAWLLRQQFHQEHPYTHAAPGGWAWTDLPGGVPNADDTAGALLAIKALGGQVDEVVNAAARGVRWLLDLQNADGGMPTFCRGWGTLPFDRSSPDLTAHAVRAWLAWRDELSKALPARIDNALAQAQRYLARTQRENGAWSPLWFGNQCAPGNVNFTYGTSRVLLALVVNAQRSSPSAIGGPDTTRAIDWLVQSQNADGGWGGTVDTPSSVEETALAVESLSAVLAAPVNGAVWLREFDHMSLVQAVQRGVSWLVSKTNCGRHFPAAPIGFYFANLWYHEELYPLIFTFAALGRASHIVAELFRDVGSLSGEQI